MILVIIEATIIAEKIRVKKQNEFLKELIMTSLIHQTCGGEVCVNYESYSYQDGYCYCYINNSSVYKKKVDI